MTAFVGVLLLDDRRLMPYSLRTHLVALRVSFRNFTVTVAFVLRHGRATLIS